MFRRLWRRFWQRAPRQLKFTRDGKIIVGIALAAGFAAINTGNNLLFLGWGLVLSAIVLSGVLSEGTMQAVAASAQITRHARVDAPTSIILSIHNPKTLWPAYSLDVFVKLSGVDEELVAPFVLRLSPQQRRALRVPWLPTRRGLHEIEHLRVETAFPFGFFEKSRRLRSDQKIWVAPRKVPVDHLLARLLARSGQSPARQVGVGEDFFDLRPYRLGDDPRRIHWRRTAQSGRVVVSQTEAMLGQRIVVELPSLEGVGAGAAEESLEVAGSLCEALLARGYAVGLLAPGCLVSPQRGARQAAIVLEALARLDCDAPLRVHARLPQVSYLGIMVGGRKPANTTLTVSGKAA